MLDPANDEPAGGESAGFVLVQRVGELVAERREEQQAAGLGDAPELEDPGSLEVLREVGEDRERPDGSERPVRVGERWLEVVPGEAREGELARAPFDERRVQIRAVQIDAAGESRISRSTRPAPQPKSRTAPWPASGLP